MSGAHDIMHFTHFSHLPGILASRCLQAEVASGSTDPAVLTEVIGRWNERKGRLFTEAHVSKAVSRLEALGWIGL